MQHTTSAPGVQNHSPVRTSTPSKALRGVRPFGESESTDGDAPSFVVSKIGHHFGQYAISSTPSDGVGVTSNSMGFFGGVIQRNGDKNKSKKTPPPPKKTPPPPEKEDEDSFEKHLGFMGAKQQGMVSQDKGKHYAGPESMVGRRTEQVLRHVGNLALNRVAATQKDNEDPAPVEVQTSSVGGNLLINTNNRSSDLTLSSGLEKDKSLKSFLFDPSSKLPAMDKDKDRPLRYRTKLDKALKGERSWQQLDKHGKPPKGEDPLDVERATRILTTIQSGKVGAFDLDDDEAMNDELEKWDEALDEADSDEDMEPRVGVVLHPKKSKIKDEHAERVQSDFRSKHLKDFEDEHSAPPTGPKTPCFGCMTYHDTNHPHFNLKSPYSGAYFSSSSPVTTPKEKQRALSLVQSRPATGSVSQSGYVRNSDYPDSDTDTEGNPVYPRPRSFSVPFGDKAPKKRTWEVTKGEEQEYASNYKRGQVLKKMKREEAKKSKLGVQKTSTKFSKSPKKKPVKKVVKKP